MATSFAKRLLLVFYVAAEGGMLVFASAFLLIVYLNPKNHVDDTSAITLCSNIIMFVLGKLTGVLLSRVLVPPKSASSSAPSPHSQ